MKLMQLNVGDSVGAIYKRNKSGQDYWELIEDQINKITLTKNMEEDILQNHSFIR